MYLNSYGWGSFLSSFIPYNSNMPVVPFITFDAVTNCYSIPTATKTLLESIESPVAVIVICGMYRSGKSTLLNKCLLDCKPGHGFGVGSTISACTKGIWLHFQPTTSGKQVLILDAEGAFSLSANKNHDTKIFVLSLLLSSYFIYNSVKSIDSSALQNLSLVTNLSKFIQTQRGSDSRSLVHVLPSLLWVIRDFSLQLVDQDGQHLTANQYLEQALTPSPGTDEDTVAVQEVMRNAFSSKECRTLLRPCANEEDLQNLDNLDDTALRPEFLKEIADLRQHIFREAPLKKIGEGEAQRLVSGALLYQLASEYVATFNKGECPVIEDSWKLVGQKQTSQLLVNLEAQYRNYLHNLPVSNLPNLLAAAAPQAVIQQFREQAMYPQWEEKLQLALQQVVNEVTVIHNQQITHRIHACLSEFQKDVSRVNDFSQLRHLVQTTNQQLEEQYGENATSLFQQCWFVTQWDVWTKFNENTASFLLKLQQGLNSHQQTLAEQQTRLADDLLTIQALQQTTEKLREKERLNQVEITESVAQLRQLHLQEKTDWEQRQVASTVITDKTSKVLRQSFLDLQNQYQDCQMELEALKEKYSELTTRYSNLTAKTTEFSSLLVAHQQLELDFQQLTDAHQSLQSTFTEYKITDENELTAVQAELVKWRQHTVNVLEQLKSQHGTELASYRQQTLQLEKMHQEAVRQRIELQNQLKSVKEQLEEATDSLQSEQHSFGQQMRLAEIQHREEIQRLQKEFDLAKDLHTKERNDLQLMLHTTETNAAVAEVRLTANKRKLDEYENHATEQKLRELNEKLTSTVSSLQTKAEWLERLYKQTQSDLSQSSSTVSKLQQQYNTLQRQHEIELLRLTLTHEMVSK